MSNNAAETIAFFETSCHPQESFQMALERFVNNVNEFRRAHFAKWFSVTTPAMVKVMEGGKVYIRVVSEEVGSRSVYCFIEVATGDILKADSWKRPAKGRRGSVFSSDWASYGCTEYGAAYATARSQMTTSSRGGCAR